MIMFADGSVAGTEMEARMQRLWSQPQSQWSDDDARWYGALQQATALPRNTPETTQTGVNKTGQSG